MVVNEALPHIMSTQHFLEEQGYKLKKAHSTNTIKVL